MTQYIVRVTQKKTREIVVRAPNAKEAERRGIEALGVKPAAAK